MPMPVIRSLSLALCLLAGAPAMAGVAALCDKAAAAAARATGVPAEVLLALTRTETGRADHGVIQPWPWAVNRAGTGYWLADRPTAVAQVTAAVQEGATNIDIGCFQINYGWHGQAFASIDAMFDPRGNALYAAGFLLDLYRETGDWRLAAGAFHSRRAADAASYLDRFDQVMAGLPDADAVEAGRWMPAEPRVNSYPLLAGGTGSRGSLVPATDLQLALLPASGARPLFGP